jgi:hypothetical protein
VAERVVNKLRDTAELVHSLDKGVVGRTVVEGLSQMSVIRRKLLVIA